MRRNAKVGLFVLVTIVLQALLMRRFGSFGPHLSFLDGVPIAASFPIVSQLLMYWFLPVAGMSLYFSGFLSDRLQSYGKVLIVRKFSKSKWAVQRYLKFIVILAVFVVMQGFLTFQEPGTPLSAQSAGQLGMYFFTLLTVFGAQILLELYVSSRIAPFLTNFYIILSVLIAQRLIFADAPNTICYLFLPNYAMGFRTGISRFPVWRTEVIDPAVGFTILIVLQAGILMAMVYRIKRMDIY
ncbi:MAG TPA: DUF2705 family protein [Bacillales bacterium]|nr:DUF2705 family protein [Bacillales bacterium]